MEQHHTQYRHPMRKEETAIFQVHLPEALMETVELQVHLLEALTAT